jgi:hypothetical protein
MLYKPVIRLIITFINKRFLTQMVQLSIKNLFKTWLSEYQWYRKRVGGTWYQVVDPDNVTAWHSPTPFWTTEKRDNHELIRTEKHSGKKSSILNPWLSDYRWYRKRIGGIWYHVKDNLTLSGFDQSNTFWTMDKPDNCELLTVENYNSI